MTSEEPDKCTVVICFNAPTWTGTLASKDGGHVLAVQYCESHALSQTIITRNAGLTLTLEPIAPEKPVGADLNDVLIDVADGAMSVYHEPCGAVLLHTVTVHLDTLARIAAEHVCEGI